ncbi:MAG: glycoside hydrolase 43 family protein [Lachnospiraceae bacterium]
MKNFIYNADNGDGTYTNPILYTDYSDPDVCRVGDDYYLVASSFCNTPAIPVLHSTDLVNWELISYVLEQIPEPGYEVPQHGHGVWAPAIRYHDGEFLVYYPMPDEGIFMCRARDARGPWSAPVCVKAAKGWIDPCPFWDDDGKAYLVNAFAKSRIGFKSILHLSPLSPDGTHVLSEGRHIFDGHLRQPTIEGPKMYKRNGWYYIFAPAGSVESGWQTVLRSRSVFGPYEDRIVMIQAGTKTNGPHQGGWVDTPLGEDWFVHFQDVGPAGRILHLEPMVWENDWPVIGKNETGEGFGTPVTTWAKPKVREGVPVKIQSPADSDDFSGDRPGLQWQWNANHRDIWYRMEHPGLRLFAQPVSAPLCDEPNLLLQKWTAPEFSAEFAFDLSGLGDGDEAGLVLLGREYSAIAFRKRGSALQMTLISGTIGGEETEEPVCDLGEAEQQLRLQIGADGTYTFFLKEGAKGFVPVTEPAACTAGYWVGSKYGVFALHRGEKEAGSVLVKFCRVRAGISV